MREPPEPAPRVTPVLGSMVEDEDGAARPSHSPSWPAPEPAVRARWLARWIRARRRRLPRVVAGPRAGHPDLLGPRLGDRGSPAPARRQPVQHGLEPVAAGELPEGECQSIGEAGGEDASGCVVLGERGPQGVAFGRILARDDRMDSPQSPCRSAFRDERASPSVVPARSTWPRSGAMPPAAPPFVPAPPPLAPPRPARPYCSMGPAAANRIMSRYRQPMLEEKRNRLAALRPSANRRCVEPTRAYRQAAAVPYRRS